MYIYIYIYIIYIYTCIYAYIHTHMHKCMSVCIRISYSFYLIDFASVIAYPTTIFPFFKHLISYLTFILITACYR